MSACALSDASHLTLCERVGVLELTKLGVVFLWIYLLMVKVKYFTELWGSMTAIPDVPSQGAPYLPAPAFPTLARAIHGGRGPLWLGKALLCPSVSDPGPGLSPRGVVWSWLSPVHSRSLLSVVGGVCA